MNLPTPHGILEKILTRKNLMGIKMNIMEEINFPVMVDCLPRLCLSGLIRRVNEGRAESHEIKSEIKYT